MARPSWARATAPMSPLLSGSAVVRPAAVGRVSRILETHQPLDSSGASRRRDTLYELPTTLRSAAGSRRSLGAEARHHLPVELRVGLPGLRGDHPPVPHRLPVRDVLRPADLHIGPAVLVRRHPRPAEQPGTR